MQHYACAILWRNDRILLGKRSPHRKSYANKWDVIGGRVEADEAVDEALIRELGEEVGVVPISWRPLCILMDPNVVAHGEASYHFHVVSDWTGDGPRLANDEHTALEWFTIDEACALPDLALEEYREIFRRIVT